MTLKLSGNMVEIPIDPVCKPLQKEDYNIVEHGVYNSRAELITHIYQLYEIEPIDGSLDEGMFFESYTEAKDYLDKLIGENDE